MGALGGLAQGILAGRELRMRMQEHMDQHQQIQQEIAGRAQQQQQAEQAASMKMIQDRMNLELMGARPVTNGMVDDMLGSSPDQGAPGASATPPTTDSQASTPERSSTPTNYSPVDSSSLSQLRDGAGGPSPAGTAVSPLDQLRASTAPAGASAQPSAPITRKANRAQVVSVPWFGGQKMEYELPTPQQQVQRQAQMEQAKQMREKLGLASAENAADLFVRNARGQRAPDDIAAFYGIDQSNPHNKFKTDELVKMKTDMMEARAKGLTKLGPGETLLDTSGA